MESSGSNRGVDEIGALGRHLRRLERLMVVLAWTHREGIVGCTSQSMGGASLECEECGRGRTRKASKCLLSMFSLAASSARGSRGAVPDVEMLSRNSRALVQHLGSMEHWFRHSCAKPGLDLVLLLLWPMRAVPFRLVQREQLHAVRTLRTSLAYKVGKRPEGEPLVLESYTGRARRAVGKEPVRGQHGRRVRREALDRLRVPVC